MIASWQPLQDTVSEFRTECSDLETVVDGLFDEVDRLRDELASRITEVTEQQQRLLNREDQLDGQRDETSRLTHQLEQREARLEETLAELREAQEQLAAQQQLDTDAASDQQTQWQQRIDELLQEQSGLRRQLDQSQADLTRLADTEAELSKTRQLLHDARAQLDEQRQAISVTHQGGPADDVGDLLQERDALEAELELVRGQAAELNETISEQKHQLDHQQSAITGEVDQLRRLVEKQAELIAERALSAEPAAARTPTPPPSESAPDDPVVTAVMAQIAKLQRDVAQRRRRKA
jgi:chromosome segregation ATPase